jgi:uncharacterized membrane protein
MWCDLNGLSWWGHSLGSGWFSPFSIVFWGLVIAVATWLISKALGTTRSRDQGRHDRMDSLEILNRKLAAGEIGLEEYQRIKQVITS